MNPWEWHGFSLVQNAEFGAYLEGQSIKHKPAVKTQDLCKFWRHVFKLNQVTAACSTTSALIFPVRESEEDIEPAMRPREATSKTQPIDHWLRLKTCSSKSSHSIGSWMKLQCFHRDLQQTKTCYVLMANKLSSTLQVFRTHPSGFLLGLFFAKVLSQWSERDQVNVKTVVQICDYHVGTPSLQFT